MASKIFPFAVGNSLHASFKLILIAEGFTAAQRGQFAALCCDLIDTLLATTPFNRTRARPEWLTVIKIFAASASSGPRVGNDPSHATVLGSFVDLATNRLVVDHSLLEALVSAQTIAADNGPVPISTLYGSGDINYGVTGGLLAILTPPVTNPAAGADDHFRPSNAQQYHLVSTTANGLWQQVILRGIGTALGLVDEFERAEPAFGAPTETSPERVNAPNVHFSETPPVMNGDVMAWRHVMSAPARLAPAVVHAHPPNDLPNTTTPAAPYADGQIAFWEGAAGFRRKAYRASEDCLMRRAPGRGYLPARSEKVSFCPVCASHIRSAIG